MPAIFSVGPDEVDFADLAARYDVFVYWYENDCCGGGNGTAVGVKEDTVHVFTLDHCSYCSAIEECDSFTTQSLADYLAMQDPDQPRQRKQFDFDYTPHSEIVSKLQSVLLH